MSAYRDLAVDRGARGVHCLLLVKRGQKDGAQAAGPPEQELPQSPGGIPRLGVPSKAPAVHQSEFRFDGFAAHGLLQAS